MITRYAVPVAEATRFLAQARPALDVLTTAAGCAGARLGRSVDDPTLWTLTTTWTSVGAYRRALSSYEVKLVAVPLMYLALDEPTAYEDVITWSPEEGTRQGRTGRAADADVVNLGEAATPHAPRDLP